MTDRSASEILRAIAGNLQAIFRSHVRLARAELREDLVEARRSAALLAAGLWLTACAIGFALLAAVYALTLVVPAWGAALVVSSATTAAGLVLVARGRAGLRRIHPRPDATIASLKETFPWATKPTT